MMGIRRECYKASLVCYYYKSLAAMCYSIFKINANDVKLYLMFPDEDNCKPFYLDIDKVIKRATLWQLKIIITNHNHTN